MGFWGQGKPRQHVGWSPPPGHSTEMSIQSVVLTFHVKKKEMSEKFPWGQLKRRLGNTAKPTCTLKNYLFKNAGEQSNCA